MAAMAGDMSSKPVNRARQNKKANMAKQCGGEGEGGGRKNNGGGKVKAKAKAKSKGKGKVHASGQSTGKAKRGGVLKMDRKNVHSRAYHHAYAKLVKEGIDKVAAKQQACVEARLAAAEWDRSMAYAAAGA